MPLPCHHIGQTGAVRCAHTQQIDRCVREQASPLSIHPLVSQGGLQADTYRKQTSRTTPSVCLSVCLSVSQLVTRAAGAFGRVRDGHAMVQAFIQPSQACPAAGGALRCIDSTDRTNKSDRPGRHQVSASDGITGCPAHDSIHTPPPKEKKKDPIRTYHTPTHVRHNTAD